MVSVRHSGALRIPSPRERDPGGARTRRGRRFRAAAPQPLCEQQLRDLWQGDDRERDGRRPSARRSQQLRGEPAVRAAPTASRRRRAVFSRTGGLQPRASSTRAVRSRWPKEDVGRHNAVDKVVAGRSSGGACRWRGTCSWSRAASRTRSCRRPSSPAFPSSRRSRRPRLSRSSLPSDRDDPGRVPPRSRPQRVRPDRAPAGVDCAARDARFLRRGQTGRRPRVGHEHGPARPTDGRAGAVCRRSPW